MINLLPMWYGLFASLQSDLKRARDQLNMGNLMVTTLVILTFFIFSLNLRAAMRMASFEVFFSMSSSFAMTLESAE